MEQVQEDGTVRDGDDPLNYDIELIQPMDEEIMQEESEIQMEEVQETENPKNDEFFDEQPIELKIPENVTDIQNLNENCEHFSCSTCDITFTSVMEHIEAYHDGQQVIIEASNFINLHPSTIGYKSILTIFTIEQVKNDYK